MAKTQETEKAVENKDKKEPRGTDNPLKQLFKGFPKAFAEWLLEEPVESIKEENIELPVSAIRSDQVFSVILASGEKVVFHVEFEAKSDTEVMKWRMLNYLARISTDLKTPVRSVVLYLNNMGKKDTGKHSIGSLSWNYETIRLDQMEARELLETDSPAMWTLSSLAKHKEPEEAFEAVDKIKANADNKDRSKLLELFVALLRDERLAEVIQEQLERDGYLMNSPFLKKIRTKEREEIAKGMKEKGIAVEIIAELTQLSVEEINQLEEIKNA